MRFGGNDAEVLARLAWLRDEFGPLFGAALRAAGGVPLNPLIARGLTMGDEMHQRNVACTSLLVENLWRRASRAEKKRLTRHSSSSRGNDQFFLNVGDGDGQEHPRSGAAASPARPSSPRCAATAPTSASGSRAWATPGSPRRSRCRRACTSPASARRTRIPTSATRRSSRRSASARSPWRRRRRWPASSARAASARRSPTRARWARSRSRAIRSGPIPALEFAGAPTGIDIRRVAETGIAPAINTGIAHRRAGVGQVGAGVARAPLACFEQALRAFEDSLKSGRARASISTRSR